MEIINPRIIFLSIILIIGALTTYTDIKIKKIYNLHLIIGTSLGLCAVLYTAVFMHEDILFHIINGLVAFLIGFLLHRTALWRGGDAKLFSLYAFLMPTPAYNHIIFPSVVSLFACSFIAGMIILFPVFIKDIIINRKTITKDLFSQPKRHALYNATGTVIVTSWILFPLYYFARITDPLIILTVSYLFFSWGYSVKKEVNKHYILDAMKKGALRLSLFLIFGLIMRLWLSPVSLSLPAFSRFIIRVILSSVISTCILTTFNHFKDYKERVSFAPLLLMGCILSYTPFLTRLIHVATEWNILFYSK